ncbi:hypothetical protein BGZ97_000187 [Linnemannia gamsii]|jgi:hypothetical protein|uniref:Uncharacterized protein n=1 Tax=Linnemannia gamsii TaxID=64522 RepID=A0A9P6R2X4_9FUNG|nr:hypothetical protein BGZ97_000187 [Linnemannia gamsii]
MFMLSWIRSSDNQAANNNKATSTSVDQHQQSDDWVLLPADEETIMNASISDLQLLSASTMTLRPSSTHPASATRTATSSSMVSTTAVAVVTPHKSRRQLKQEMRLQQAQEELERRPRYDPMIAKMRDYEFKLAKLQKLGMRSGRIASATTGGAHSVKSMRGSGTAGGPQVSASPAAKV